MNLMNFFLFSFLKAAQTRLILNLQELSQLRFKLCPRLLKEEQFWRIYFQLVRNLVAK